ncbi:MAG: lysoplasmalogenase [Acidimicrobiales bacterium]|nr:lysoplasmalogenase [Acidimicrobiales bacterium]
MNATASLWLGLTLAVAVCDWVAVALGNKKLEYVCKPLTMVVLIAAAFALDVSDVTVRNLFVPALVLSLVGDVLLMLPRESLFVFGLGSFLLAHIGYIAGMWVVGVSAGWLAAGMALVAVAVLALGRRLYRGVKETKPQLALPVACYIGVISVMVASAFGRRHVAAIVGACLFYASDALIAWDRFVAPKAWARLAIIITYHLGQLGLVVSLAG